MHPYGKIIVLHVSVDREYTPQQALANLSWEIDYEHPVLTDMPCEGPSEIDVHFFRVGKRVSGTQLAEEYEKRNLKPADPFSLLAVNETYPNFIEDHPNRTVWIDDQGRRCEISFIKHWVLSRNYQTRYIEKKVYFLQEAADAHEGKWWFAGVRNQAPINSKGGVS